jgi:hypothetical protein
MRNPVGRVWRRVESHIEMRHSEHKERRGRRGNQRDRSKVMETKESRRK